MKSKNIKQGVLVALVSAVTAIICIALYAHFSPRGDVFVADGNPMPVRYASYSPAGAVPTDFAEAARTVIPVTVHINTKVPPKSASRQDPYSFFDDPYGGLFGGQRRYRSPGKLASGSGVIVSKDGYIVTNNHVVDGASDMVVTLSNGKKYRAKIVGTDPNTDLAVIKIDADNLPSVVFGNSDNAEVGEWVLACGYPLNLQTTVTAGIISAKSRDLGINDEGINPIESYLQTDAAVNPGNSGGPLVDTHGQLVGINSAIASPTGAFAGYAYAIPSNLVRKVVDDILQYGTVQRAFLGVQIMPSSMDPRRAMSVAFDPDEDQEPGVKVRDVVPGGGAVAAGIRKGDVITGIDNTVVNTEADLLGTVARYHPGDAVKVTFLRDGQKHQVSVTLKNKNGTTDIIKNTVMDALGADFRNMTPEIAKQYGVPQHGVLVAQIVSGLIKQQTDMQPGFVILRAGNYPVRNIEDLKKALQEQGNNILLQGYYLDSPGTYNYAINDLKSGLVN